MIVIPAVDIKDGKCVQLVQGKPGTELVILDNPAGIAHDWERRGAKMIHVIDLGGALDGLDNLEAVSQVLKEVSVPVQMGGGIRSKEDATKILDMGVERVILGTVAIQNPKVVSELSEEYGSSRIVVALDSKDSQVVVKGWTEKTGKTAPEMGALFQEKGAGGILFTNVDYEGLLGGFSVEPINNLLSEVDIPVIYSGGVSSLEDVAILSKLNLEGVVIGSALYKGALEFEAALKYES